ncbi:DNA repair protein RecN [Neptunomonas antarctica]|uniref:DNA repair protein RecN n=1 Tax=Neptunomonas antarctica TaxID=619304 RepID=A0A1N7J627_9GAMM|nr:DNA repair protein RecN [Neptunomonas antarctica]SIS44772.1 DNA replication and repair protein RecN [Neptunomonas antarctica]
MLMQLTIRNYAIVESLDLELKSGMTVVSGETGAGKSIMLDALGLTLGYRADSGSVRHGAERAEIIASFNIEALHDAKQWLKEQDLDQDNECIIRRVITREGRSRSYINGQPCPLNALKEFGEYLIAIHGQHEHQRLLKKEHHRELLDQFANQTTQAQQIKSLYQHWQKKQKHLELLLNQGDEHQAKVQLLSYQMSELDQLGMLSGELSTLEEEQKTLSQAGDILQNGQLVLTLTTEGEQENCSQILTNSLHLLAELKNQTPVIDQISELLNSAQIQIEEASQELRHYLDRVEINPERLINTEERLTSIYDIARKHRVAPETLPAFHQQLQQELDSLQHSDDALEQLSKEVDSLRTEYMKAAAKLGKARTKAAIQINKQINEQLHLLGMTSACFIATLTINDKPQASGLEDVEFLISTNKGQLARPLAKIASGGELSRISLAIQVITAQCSTTPTLIFDEVDVGIGGAIAEVVGRMLRQLGERAQIMCVTHQPQVASQGNQHLFVSKRADKEHTHTHINTLSQEDRIQEIARMLGGIDVTQRSIDHAKEMLGYN